MRPCNALFAVLMLIAPLLVNDLNAQQRDPRIGEWREDRTATSVGLYNVFEDLGDGTKRYHIAQNLAPQNRLYIDYRCDGQFYPVRNNRGIATDFSQSCTIVDGNTVTMKGARNRDVGFAGPRIDEYWRDGDATGTISADGKHYRVIVQQKAADGRVIGIKERTFTLNAERCFSSDEQKFRECQRRTRPSRK